MASTIQLSFKIYLTDAEKAREYQTRFPQGLIHGPIPTATELSAELGYTVAYQTNDEQFTAPCVRTEWHPAESSGKFLYDRAVFTIGGGGFFGWLGFGSRRFVWVGTFVYSPVDPPAEDDGSGLETENAPLPQRKFIDGFATSAATSPNASVEAQSGTGRLLTGGRFPGDLTIAARSQSDSVTQDTDILSSTAGSWERYYITLLRASATNVAFWKIVGLGGTGSEGLKAYITPTGAIAMYGVDNVAAETLVGTSPVLVVGTEYKIDTVFEFYTDTNTLCQFQLLINGVVAISGAPQVRSGVTSLKHSSSQLMNTGTGHSLELNIANWVCAEIPDRFKRTTLPWNSTHTYSTNDYVSRTVGGKTRYYRAVAGSTNVTPPNAASWIQSLGPVDFYSGSKLVLVRPTVFGSGHSVNWSGLVGTLERSMVEVSASAGTLSLSSSTSGAICEVETDAKDLGFGAAAIAFGVLSSKPSGANGSVGLSLAGAGFADTSLTEGTTAVWLGVLDRPAALTAPRLIAPFKLRYTKGASVQTVNLVGLLAVVEYIGNFGPNDYVADPTLDSADDPTPEFPTVPQGPHNYPYPKSIWAAPANVPPAAGVYVKSGTFTGTSTWKDLTFPVPLHLVWVRPTATGAGVGSRWWSSMLNGGHYALEGSGPHSGRIRGLNDASYVSDGAPASSEEQYIVRLGGADASINNSARTYQYVAISDPGGRFMLSGSCFHGANALDDGANFPLSDSGFAAAFGLFWAEYFASTRDTATARFYGKGPGHAANEASRLDTSATASLINYATTGVLKLFSSINNLGMQLSFCLFRALENNPTIETADQPVVFQIVSWVGNGGGARTITLTPTSLRRPLFAIVIPDNGAAWFRDPSHSSAASQNVNSSTTTTANGIVGGGIDQLLVGSSLNANGVDYSALVCVGGTTAGNDGWSANGEFIPAGLEMPAGAQWPDPPFDLDDLTDDEINNLTPFAGPVDEDLTNLVDNEPALVPFTVTTPDLSSMCDRVLHRLGDTAQAIWTKAEIYSYLVNAASELADQTHIIWDRMEIDDILELTGQKTTLPGATVDLPKTVLEIERATWGPNYMMIDALSPRDLARADTRYEITTGEVFGYTWRKDGIRTMRLIRVPPENPVEVRIDIWRHFEVSCSLSELPRRYFMYLGDYVQWMCLKKNGPGQNYKLAQLYKDRWDRNIGRVKERVSRKLNQRMGRMGGTGDSGRGKPPRPRLPWPYGSRVR